MVLDQPDKKVVIAILEADVMLACRKETLGNLKKLMSLTEGRIFKGRLQLSKHGDIIEVIVKNTSVAVLGSSVFEQALNNLCITPLNT